MTEEFKDEYDVLILFGITSSNVEKLKELSIKWYAIEGKTPPKPPSYIINKFIEETYRDAFPVEIDWGGR